MKPPHVWRDAPGGARVLFLVTDGAPDAQIGRIEPAPAEVRRPWLIWRCNGEAGYALTPEDAEADLWGAYAPPMDPPPPDALVVEALTAQVREIAAAVRTEADDKDGPEGHACYMAAKQLEEALFLLSCASGWLRNRGRCGSLKYARSKP